MIDNFEKKLDITTFLLQMQTLFAKYNFDDSNIRNIYKHLATYGIPSEEKTKKLSEYFEKFQEENKDNPKMEVFVAEYWKYFCQFKSKQYAEVINKNPIKLYIPLKKENIEYSIKKIFEFINENDIAHVSKLATDVRVDDLVVRVGNKEDAEKIINYINNNKEITENMYNPNPFCINEGNVGLAMDRRLSYNDIVSRYVYYYLKEEVNNKNIASYDGFKQFVTKNLAQLKSKENLAEQIKKYTQTEHLENLPLFLQNFEEITVLILKNLEGQSKEELYEYFYTINTPEYNEQKKAEYSDFEYKKMNLENSMLLKEIIIVMYKKYGEYITRNNLKSYKEKGGIEKITKTNNLRERVEQSKTFRTYINYIDLDKEIDILMSQNNLNQENINKTEDNLSKETLLEMICKETYLTCQTKEREYMGKEQVATALVSMKFSNYRYITRTNNARKIAEENIKPQEVEEIMKNTLEKNGYIIENEIDLYHLYATHIEYICNNKEMGRGRK